MLVYRDDESWLIWNGILNWPNEYASNSPIWLDYLRTNDEFAIWFDKVDYKVNHPTH